MADDKDSVLFQKDCPSGVKEQVPSVRDIATLADLPQHLPVTPRTDNPQQTKDRGRKDHLQAPKEALNTSPYNQQLTAQDRIYIMVQPMPAPGTVKTPYFTGQNVSQFIKRYKLLCARHRVTGIEKYQGLPEYYNYWIGM